jgi:hypothetical protein
MEEERRELEQAKEEYQTPELIKHGTVEELTQTTPGTAGTDTFQGLSTPA